MKLPQITHSHEHVPEALRERSAFSLIGRDPYVDWVASILLSVIVAIILIVAGYFVYNRTEASLNEPVSVTKTDDKVSKEIKTLDEIISEFDKRANITKNLNYGYDGFGDPAI